MMSSISHFLFLLFIVVVVLVVDDDSVEAFQAPPHHRPFRNIPVLPVHKFSSLSTASLATLVHPRSSNNNNNNYNYYDRIRIRPMERRRRRRSNHNTLYALIYGADGSVSNTEDDNDDEYDSNSNSKDGDGGDDARYSFLVESLRTHFSTDGNPNVWATIGCAFAPPPHHELSLTVIQEATLLRVGTSTLDISLAVPVAAGTCEQLLQILVTVGYPQAISFLELEKDQSEEKEDPSVLVATVIQQIQVLAGHAKDRLATRVRKTSQQQKGKSEAEGEQYSYERLVIEQRVLEELQQEPSAKEIALFPEWWTTIAVPTFPFPIVKECQQSLKPLLNEEEFEDELRALFVQYYDNGSNGSNTEQLLVLRSAVASIGASGLYLKARCAIVQSLDHDNDNTNTNNNQNQNSEIRHCLIPYTSNSKTRTVLSTMNEIQEGVLTLVESVTPLPKPTVPLSSTSSPSPSTSSSTTTDDNNNEDDVPFIPFNEAVMESVTAATTAASTTSISASPKSKSKQTVVQSSSSSKVDDDDHDDDDDDHNDDDDDDDDDEQQQKEEQQEAIVAASFGFADLVATDQYDDDDNDGNHNDADNATTKIDSSETPQQSTPAVVPQQQQQQQQPPYSSVLVDNDDDNTEEQQKQEAAIIAAIAATDYSDSDIVNDDDEVAGATTKTAKMNGDHESQSDIVIDADTGTGTVDTEIMMTTTATTTTPTTTTLESLSENDDNEQENKVMDQKHKQQRQRNMTTLQQQPKSFEEESKLAAKYNSIEDLGERAFVILRDLEMI